MVLISYLFVSALVSVSEEVRSRCHVKHSLARMIPESGSCENFPVDSHLSLMPTVSISDNFAAKLNSSCKY
jgi:hypothetical protein